MPFNKETAAAAGSKGGGRRWEGKDPETNRNVQMNIRVTTAERDWLNEKATASGMKLPELVLKAVRAYKIKD